MERTVSDPTVRVRGNYAYVSFSQDSGWTDYVTYGDSGDGWASVAEHVIMSGTCTYAGSDLIPAAQKTRVAIDPNIRIRGNSTYAGFEDVDGPIAVGEMVEVIESESGLVGQGKVTEIDGERKLVYLSVDWASLTDMGTSSNGTPSHGGVFYLTGSSSLISEGCAGWMNLMAQPSLAYVGVRDRAVSITGPASVTWGDIFASQVTSTLVAPYMQITQPYADLRTNRAVALAWA